MNEMRKLFLLLAAVLVVFVACGEESNGGGGTADTEETTDAGSGDCATDEEVETASGLRYVDIKCGEGEEAAKGDSVEVHYIGKLENGKKFDASRDRGQTLPFQIGAGQLIAGFDEGVIGMRVGGVRELTIPPELGYGDAGQPPVIPPNSTLIFEVELVSITSSS